jgi:hypothetical protein
MLREVIYRYLFGKERPAESRFTPMAIVIIVVTALLFCARPKTHYSGGKQHKKAHHYQTIIYIHSMKFTTSFYFAVTYACSFLLSLVVSELKMTVLLNNGVLPSQEGYNCNANDSLLIQSAIVSLYNRDLQKTKAQCKDACSGYVSGSCHVTGCTGFRRQLEQQDPRKNRLSGNRRLNIEDDAVCAFGIDLLNKKLDGLLPQLSTSCRPLVQSRRVVSCFDDVRYAMVEGFNIWNADTDTVLATNVQNSTSICFTKSNLNIEAIANACVKEVHMTLTGPVKDADDSKGTAPYTLFGFESNNRKNLYGRQLPIGTYTVSSELQDSFTPTSRVTFTVKKC